MAHGQPFGEGGLHGRACVGRTSERDLRGVGKTVRALRQGSGRDGQKVGDVAAATTAAAAAAAAAAAVSAFAFVEQRDGGC